MTTQNTWQMSALKTFGDNGGLLVIAVQTDKFFEADFFNSYTQLIRDLKNVQGIEGILSVPGAVNLMRAEESERLQALPVFKDTILTKQQIDSGKGVFLNIPFYRGLLYNAETKAWLMAVTVNNAIFNSPNEPR